MFTYLLPSGLSLGLSSVLLVCCAPNDSLSFSVSFFLSSLFSFFPSFFFPFLFFNFFCIFCDRTEDKLRDYREIDRETRTTADLLHWSWKDPPTGGTQTWCLHMALCLSRCTKSWSPHHYTFNFTRGFFWLSLGAFFLSLI